MSPFIVAYVHSFVNCTPHLTDLKLHRLTSILSSRFILNLRWAGRPVSRVSEPSFDPFTTGRPPSGLLGNLGEPLVPYCEHPKPDSHAQHNADTTDFETFAATYEPFGRFDPHANEVSPRLLRPAPTEPGSVDGLVNPCTGLQVNVLVAQWKIFRKQYSLYHAESAKGEVVPRSWEAVSGGSMVSSRCK